MSAATAQKGTEEDSPVVFLPGDHLRLDSGFFDHHAIFVCWTYYPYCGHVVHHSGKVGGTKTILEEEINNLDKYELVTRPMEGDVVVSRARSRSGEGGYNLLTRNCEHFTNWCLTGDCKSNQVIRGTTVIGGSLVSFVGAPEMGMNLIASGLNEQIQNDLRFREFGHISTCELQRRLATTVIATGSAAVGGVAGATGGMMSGASVGTALAKAALAGGVVGAGVAAGAVAGQHLGANASRRFLGDDAASFIAGMFYGEDGSTRGLERACEVLGVLQDALDEEINRAFQRLAMECHPDRPNGSHEQFVVLQAALEKIRLSREPLEIGTHVEADWNNCGSYCPGCILFANADGSYQISYEHGGDEECVARSRIRVLA